MENIGNKKIMDKNTVIWWIIGIVLLLLMIALHFKSMLAGMDALLIIAFFLIIYKARVQKSGFFPDYIARNSTSAINGIFILLILFTHAYGYMNVTADNMPLFFFFRSHCRQLVVTTFLFYSGYGIMESVKKKGVSYINSMPLKRVLPLWIKFAIAVCIFAVIMLAFGQDVTVGRFIGSLLTWKNVGNSNWYVTAILILYLIAYVSFRAFGSVSQKAAIVFSVLGTFVFIMILIHFRETESYTYNTIFCFPAGIIYSYYKERIEKLVQNSRFSYWTTLVTSILVFLIAYGVCDNYGKFWNLFWYQIMCIAFALMLTFLAMKLKFENRFLLFLGGPMLFSIYILMRIPMNILSWSEAAVSPSVFFVVSAIVTILIAWVFTKLTNGLIKRVFK